MPNRIIRESINESRGLALASPFAQDLYKRLITYADDHGRFNADREIVRSRLYPRELDAVTVEEIDAAMLELVGIEKVKLYTAAASSAAWMGETVFGLFPNWTTHQRLRNTRSKHPDPASGAVNDWALRVHIPVDIKRFIFTRDRFSCQICKKAHKLDLPINQAVRILGSIFHIDHIVPVRQGGRATKENLRLVCAPCNLKRKRSISIAELADLAATCGELPQPAADCGELPPESEARSEKREARIRSEKCSPETGEPSAPGFAEFWDLYPRKVAKGAAAAAWGKLTAAEREAALLAVPAQSVPGAQLDIATRADADGRSTVPHPATWLNGKRWGDGIDIAGTRTPAKNGTRDSSSPLAPHQPITAESLKARLGMRKP